MINQYPPCRILSRRAFTLVELLVAIAVLTLIMMLFTQVLRSVSGAYSQGRNDAESYSTGRALLDAIGRDLQGAFIREDLVSFPEEGNFRRLAFYTAQAGIADDPAAIRDLSFIEYYESQEEASAALIRADADIQWSSVEKIAFGSTAPPTPTPRTLSNGILAFDYRFITSNGIAVRKPAKPSSVIAVRISLAVADPKTMQVIRRTNALSSMKAGLKAAVEEETLLSAKSAWETWIDTASYPGGALGGIRLFERVVPLNPQASLE
jgi:prepilin-type N-terminal cleavage/methylation domain-containing protein